MVERNNDIMPKASSNGSTSKFVTPSSYLDDIFIVMEQLDKSMDYSEIGSYPVDLDFKTNDKALLKIFNKINSKNMCSVCKKTQFVSTNQCGHLICFECLLRKVQEKSNCEICGDEFKETLIQNLVRNASKLTSEKISIICKKCNINEIPTDIENTCGHLCLSCVRVNYKQFINECPICFGSLFREDLLTYSTKKVFCEGCNTQRNYFAENCKKFKCGHTLCGDCITFSIQSRKCKLCVRNLNNLDILEFIKAATEQCSKCYKNIALKFINMFSCCNRFICEACKGRHKCKSPCQLSFK